MVTSVHKQTLDGNERAGLVTQCLMKLRDVAVHVGLVAVISDEAGCNVTMMTPLE